MAAKIEGTVDSWEEGMELIQQLVDQMGGIMAVVAQQEGDDIASGAVFKKGVLVGEADAAIHGMAQLLAQIHTDMTTAAQATTGVVHPETKPKDPMALPPLEPKKNWGGH
jgi:hypothetical protein